MNTPEKPEEQESCPLPVKHPDVYETKRIIKDVDVRPLSECKQCNEIRRNLVTSLSLMTKFVLILIILAGVFLLTYATSSMISIGSVPFFH